MARKSESGRRRPASFCNVRNMKAIEQAQKIISELGTNNVYEIAEKFGVKIIYQNWHPITIGEFDKKSKTICVNIRGLADNKFSEQGIIAHELGHFFAGGFDLDRKSEEDFAQEFAKVLVNLK